ncbi:MAG: hypothetical protein M3522_12385 [Actinomycetota bacterium]|nr:hypothetical protein [Actinomycetota bacterium]
MQVFLDAPQDFEHVCVISRTLEALGVRRCHVHDTNRLIRPRYGKSRTRRLKKVSAGAFFRVGFERVEDPATFLSSLQGRKIGAVPDPRARACLTAPLGDQKVVGRGSVEHKKRRKIGVSKSLSLVPFVSSDTP